MTKTMARFIHFAALALLFLAATTAPAPALAQSTSTDEVVWASVVYTLYGEKTPSLSSPYGPYNLSPLGANQLVAAGSLIRSRNISPSSANNGSSQLTTGGAAVINGLSVNAIDNSQLYALSTDDEYVSASAMAFFQGLYPPRGYPILDGQNTLANGSVEGFPLDGYQYPNIGSVSSLDFNYIWIAGNIGCTSYGLAEDEELDSEAYGALTNATQPFYDSLASSVFQGIEGDEISYANAWLLYEYALYQYNHNSSHPVSEQDLSQLYNLASQAEFEFNTDNALGDIPSIAGQTFASLVLQQFQYNIGSRGVDDKLTLLFGSYEPFLAFFALSGLSTGPSAGRFVTIPQFGSLMTFELCSYTNASAAGQNTSSIPFPPTDELFVRFLFRNGTSDNESLIQYSLFGEGNAEDDMNWMDFAQGMSGFALNDVAEWCNVCNAFSQLLFCDALETPVTSDPTTTSGKKSLSPAIGGMIGAAVTLAAVFLAAAILGICGFRMERRGKGVKGMAEGGIGILKRSGSGAAGGFKGAEKLASDTDLTLKGGAVASVIRHERVGSWELGESPTSPRGQGQGSLDKDVESGRMERVVSFNAADRGRRSEDDGVDPFGEPVKPVDQV